MGDQDVFPPQTSIDCTVVQTPVYTQYQVKLWHPGICGTQVTTFQPKALHISLASRQVSPPVDDDLRVIDPGVPGNHHTEVVCTVAYVILRISPAVDGFSVILP